MKAWQRLPRYRSGRWVPVMAAPNADFEFTEGHVRILLWMCDSHQDWIEAACAKIMQNGEMPSDNLMRCREGIADLKCWGLRLLDVIEATPDDEDDEDDLFDNGWRSQRGTPDASDALATEANWYSLVNDGTWGSLGLNPANPGDKTKIVANLLAYTETSYQVQNSLGLSGSNLIKGAIVLAGKTTPFGGNTNQGLVPLLG